jgi:hypothetical protein
MKYFREDLHRRLLSPDFKKQVDGLDLLQKVNAYLSLFSHQQTGCLDHVLDLMGVSLSSLPKWSSLFVVPMFKLLLHFQKIVKFRITLHSLNETMVVMYNTPIYIHIPM